MTNSDVQHWLKEKIARHIAVCWIGAVLALIAGMVVLFVTFWLIYLALFIAEHGVSAARELLFNREFHLSRVWRLLICGLLLVALFLEWLRRSPNDLGNYGKVNSPPGSRTLVFYGGVGGAFAMLLANPQASATMITEFLYIGPRLVLGPISLIGDAFRWQKINVQDCAWVLQSLVVQERVITNEELCANLNGQDWTKLKSDMAQIPGVVYLEKGLSLAEDFRQEIVAQLATN